MNMISRRSVVRSTSALLAFPFVGALASAHASGQADYEAPPQPGRLKFSKASRASVSLDLVNFIKDHSAKAAAASHQGKVADYSVLGDQFHLLGKHLSAAGGDKAVKAYCRKALKTGVVPSIDSRAVDHAVSCIRLYAPSYSAGELMSSNAIPTTHQEWAKHLKQLKKHGVVKYLHQTGRLFNAMGRASRNQPLGLAGIPLTENYQTAAFDPTDPAQAAHIVEICSLSQKAKFFACLGVVALVGLAVIAAVAAVCGATGIVTCIGGAISASATVGFAAAVAGFTLITGALLQACSVFLAAYHKDNKRSVVYSAI
jgi:hypothetical protein